MGEGQRQHLAASGRLIYKRKCLYLNVLHSNYDFRKAVSRILSALITQGRESFVSAASTRDSFRIAEKGAGNSEVPYLALHLMGFSVPPRLRLERWALTPPFHPYRLGSNTWLEPRRWFVFCGTLRRDASRHRLPRVSVQPGF